MIKVGARNQQYLEGFNNTGSTIAKFLGVRGSYSSIALPSGVASPFFGFTTDAIADQARGDIQYAGVGIGTAAEAWDAAALLVGVRLYIDTAGKVAIWDAASGVNQTVCGLAQTISTGDGDLVEVLIGAGGIGQGA